MIEIAKTFPPASRLAADIFRISTNTIATYGFQWSPQIKLLVFEKSSGTLYIDFIAYPIVADTIYIIPATHFYKIDTAGTTYACIDIGQQWLKPHHRQLLYQIKYSKYKYLPFITGADSSDAGCFTVLQNMDVPTAPGPTIEMLLTMMAVRVAQWPVAAGIMLQHRSIYTPAAEQLLNLLNQRKLTMESCKVSTIAAELFCTERNLHRICIRIFGYSARDVLNYHLAIKALFLLAQSPGSISDIAQELAFSGTAAFDRYMKRMSGFSPSELRIVCQ